MDVVKTILAEPLRPPDALLRLAQSRVSQNCYVSARRDCPWLVQLVGFLRRRRSLSVTSADPTPGANSHLATAFAVRYEHPRLAAVIEGLILAGEPSSSIAADCGITEAAVEWYAEAFFNVRDRLSAVHFIVQEVIEPARLRQPPDFFGYVVRGVGFFAGAAELRKIIGSEAYPSSGHLVAAKRAAAQTAMELQLHAAAVEGTLNKPQTDLLSQALRVAREQADSGEEVALNDYEANIAVFLQEVGALYIAWKDKVPSPMDQYRGWPVELRAHELTALASGEGLPHLEQRKAMRMPPPRNREHDADGA